MGQSGTRAGVKVAATGPVRLAAQGSSFVGNSAGATGGAVGCFRASLRIVDSLLQENTAFDGGAVQTNSPSTFAGTRLVDNVAAHSGGAVYTTSILTLAEGTVLENNSALSGDGGAVACVSGDALLSADGVRVSGNRAYAVAGGFFLNSDTISVSNSLFSRNIAEGPFASSGAVGAVSFATSGELLMENVTFERNVVRQRELGLASPEQARGSHDNMSESWLRCFGLWCCCFIRCRRARPRISRSLAPIRTDGCRLPLRRWAGRGSPPGLARPKQLRPHCP